MNRARKALVACGLMLFAVAATAAARGLPIVCTGGICEGTPGSDLMQGSVNEDDMRGLGGRDRLEGNESDDILRGGSGGDSLSEDEDPSRDILLGGGGGDEMEGGLRGDTLRGGAGDERASLKARGSTPAFRAVGMFGDEGNDRLFGSAGDDTMEGEEGRDLMSGGGGNDYIDAVDDDTPGTKDRIDCGKGFDRFSRGPGDKVDSSCERRVPPTDVVSPLRNGN